MIFLPTTGLMERSMMSFTSQAKTLLSLGLTALTLGSAALISAAPTRAADLGYDEEIGFRPPVDRRVIVDERRASRRCSAAQRLIAMGELAPGLRADEIMGAEVRSSDDSPRQPGIAGHHAPGA
jgi:hypothetical protein